MCFFKSILVVNIWTSSNNDLYTPDRHFFQLILYVKEKFVISDLCYNLFVSSPHTTSGGNLSGRRIPNENFGLLLYLYLSEGLYVCGPGAWLLYSSATSGSSNFLAKVYFGGLSRYLLVGTAWYTAGPGESASFTTSIFLASETPLWDKVDFNLYAFGPGCSAFYANTRMFE